MDESIVSNNRNIMRETDGRIKARGEAMSTLQDDRLISRGVKYVVPKYFLLVVLFFFSFNLFAQQFVDVFPDCIYIQEKTDKMGEGIFKVNFDLSVERFMLTGSNLPKELDLGKMLAGGIRPKIRLENYWISDRYKLFRKPLKAEPDQEWESVKLPDEIERFLDFEIISDKEAILCGCEFNWPDELISLRAKLNTQDWLNLPPVTSRLYIHLVFNYKTGAITTPIESYDPTSFPYALGDNRNFFAAMKIANTFMCRFDSRIVIIGNYSGFVTILDINDNGKLRNSRKFRVVPEDELPSDPKEAVNNRSAISWVGPLLSGDDVLMCCRMWVVPKKKPSEPVSVQCFRTLNLKTGKVTFENTVYRDRKAEEHLTLFEESSHGELLSAREYMQRCIEQSKKPKATPVPEQPEKQVDQPPKIESVGTYP
jgi:hypothetical protein